MFKLDKTINIRYLNKSIKINVRKLGVFSKGIGLMFKSRESENLLFNFNKDVKISIHSFFVFFPFLVLWLDAENNVLEWKIVKPFCLRVLPKNKFRRFVEIPINEENKEIIKFFRK